MAAKKKYTVIKEGDVCVSAGKFEIRKDSKEKTIAAFVAACSGKDYPGLVESFLVESTEDKAEATVE